MLQTGNRYEQKHHREPPLFLNERYQVRNFDIFLETLYTADCKHQSTRLTSTYMVTFQTTGYLWNK